MEGAGGCQSVEAHSFTSSPNADKLLTGSVTGTAGIGGSELPDGSNVHKEQNSLVLDRLQPLISWKQLFPWTGLQMTHPRVSRLLTWSLGWKRRSRTGGAGPAGPLRPRPPSRFPATSFPPSELDWRPGIRFTASLDVCGGGRLQLRGKVERQRCVWDRGRGDGSRRAMNAQIRCRSGSLGRTSSARRKINWSKNKNSWRNYVTHTPMVIGWQWTRVVCSLTLIGPGYGSRFLLADGTLFAASSFSHVMQPDDVPFRGICDIKKSGFRLNKDFSEDWNGIRTLNKMVINNTSAKYFTTIFFLFQQVLTKNIHLVYWHFTW